MAASPLRVDRWTRVVVRSARRAGALPPTRKKKALRFAPAFLFFFLRLPPAGRALHRGRFRVPPPQMPSPRTPLRYGIAGGRHLRRLPCTGSRLCLRGRFSVSSMSNLLKSRTEIAARVVAKRARLVAWLKAEVYTDYQTAALVLGCTPATAFKALTAMQRDGLLERHAVGRASVWSISLMGQIEYLDDGDDPLSVFDPRVSETTVQHTLAVQRARIAVESAGGTAWQAERAIRREAAKAKEAGGASLWLKVPDGVVTLGGRRIAVEVERSVKTPKRYQVIIAEYLQMRKAGTIGAVHYVCGSEKLAKGLQRIFAAFPSVNIRGTEIALKPEHYACFEFYEASKWPHRAE